MTPSLRCATAADAEACGAILTAWVEETPWFPSLHTPQEDIGFVAKRIARADVRVACLTDGQVAGFIIIDGTYIASLYVARAARGLGIGAALLDHAKAERPEGFCLWTFQANTGARRFYSREGLVAERFTNGEDNEEHLPDVLFRWTPGQASHGTPNPDPAP